MAIVTAGLADAQVTGEDRTDCVPQRPFDGAQTEPLTDEVPDTSLTEQLEACDGVLEPPPVGDGEFTEPAPPIGETPVIDPDDVPVQPTR